MRLITRQKKAANAAKQWRGAYWSQADGWTAYGTDKRGRDVTHGMIEALGAAPDPDDVDAIIGNGSWTSTSCDECGAHDGRPVVELGAEPDYESSTATVCGECLTGAKAIMEAHS